jgi:hypothetical protein
VASDFFEGRAEVGMIVHSYERPASHVLAVELPIRDADVQLTRVRVDNDAVRVAIDSDDLNKPLTDLRIPYNDSRPVYLTLESHACSVGGHAALDLNAIVIRSSTGTRTVKLDLPLHLSC